MEKKANICYCIANIILTIKVMLASSSLINLKIGDSILSAIYLGLILVVLVFQKYKIKDLVLFFVIGLLASYTCLKNDNFYLIFSCLGCFAIKYVNLRKLLKYRYYTKVIIIAFHVLYTFVVFLIDPQIIPTVERGGEIRYYFYLGQPNTFQMYVLWTTLEILFVYYKSLRKEDLIVAFLVNMFFYYFTDSNSSILVLIFTLMLIYFSKYNKKSYRFIDQITKYSYFIITLIIFMMAYFYSNAGILGVVLKIVNKVMTGRLAYGAYVFQQSGITIFGSKLEFSEIVFWNGQWYDDLYLDSAYLALLLQYGVVWVVIIGYGIYKCAKLRRVIEINIFLLSYIMYGIMESYVLDASVCFPILFIGKMYFRRKQKVKYNKNELNAKNMDYNI